MRYYLPYYGQLFLVFLVLWSIASVGFNKYTYKNKKTLADFVRPVLVTDLIILSAVLVSVFIFDRFSFSRMIVLGTIGLSIVSEVILFSLFYYYRKLNRLSDNTQEVLEYLAKNGTISSSLASGKVEKSEHIESFTLKDFRADIREMAGEKGYAFINENLDAGHDPVLVLSTTTSFNLNLIPAEGFNSFVNLKPINDIKRINRFFETVNSKLPPGGIFIDYVFTNESRKKSILDHNPPVLNYIAYFFYFIFKRVFPKLPFFKKIYFFLTNGYGRALSKAESLGRLYSCGFEILSEEYIDEKLFFVARKTGEPFYDMNPTYGALISLKRMGKKNVPIQVYKFRTMHPYSEYLQEYIYKQNHLQEGGKFKDDFRVTTTGKFLRKFWIDELPMIINILKGDLKLVGVRPLSNHYFNLYSEELKKKRTEFKPGLFPPFYADLPKTLEEIMESELKYLEMYEKHPHLTDMKYFFMAFYNIVFRKARSK
ncbi:MAG: sugar transferase [Syntrophothermus sp.]